MVLKADKMFEMLGPQDTPPPPPLCTNGSE